MNSIKLAVAAVLGIAACNVARVEADQNITNNGTVWAYSYEGTFLPTDPSSNPAWSLPFSPTAGASESVTNGILTLSTPTVGDNLAFRQTGGAGKPWNPTAAGSTIEVRLRVDSQDPSGGIAQSFFVRTGTRIYWFGFATNAVEELYTGAFTLLNTTTAFHDYRFTITGLGGTGALYLDGSPTPAFTTAGAADTANVLDFGDANSSFAGTVEWDYIRWTNAGVFSVPEPSSALLLGLGAVLFVRRRKTR